jgi:hypothetical protein
MEPERLLTCSKKFRHLSPSRIRWIQSTIFHLIFKIHSNIVTCFSDYRQGFDWEIGFIDHLQIVTTNNYYTIADFRIADHSTLSLSVYLH